MLRFPFLMVFSSSRASQLAWALIPFHFHMPRVSGVTHTHTHTLSLSLSLSLSLLATTPLLELLIPHGKRPTKPSQPEDVKR